MTKSKRPFLERKEYSAHHQVQNVYSFYIIICHKIKLKMGIGGRMKVLSSATITYLGYLLLLLII